MPNSLPGKVQSNPCWETTFRHWTQNQRIIGGHVARECSRGSNSKTVDVGLGSLSGSSREHGVWSWPSQSVSAYGVECWLILRAGARGTLAELRRGNEKVGEPQLLPGPFPAEGVTTLAALRWCREGHDDWGIKREVGKRGDWYTE